MNVNIKVIKHFLNNSHVYGDKEIFLKSYLSELESKQGFIFSDHDRIEWVEEADLLSYKIAPFDIPIVKALIDGRKDV